MNKSFIGKVLIAALISLMVVSAPLSVYAQNPPGEDFTVVSAVWGTVSSPTVVYPGDQRATLFIVVQNTGVQTFYSLTPELAPLQPPFSDSTTNGSYSYSMGTASKTSLAKGDSITFQFILNIDSKATPGTYLRQLEIYYQDAVGIRYLDTLTVNLVVSSPIQLKVAQITWGTPSSPSLTEPGDKSATLSVTLQNPAANALYSVNERLYLTYPFSNITGGNIAASYVSGSMMPGAAATAQFTLNVNKDASIKTYWLTLGVSYLDQWSTLLTQNITIGIPLTGRHNIEVNSTSNTLYTGETDNLAFTVSNTGTTSVYGLSVSISVGGATSSQGSITFNPQQSAQYFQELSAKSSIPFKVDATVSPTAASGLYQAQMTLTYRDTYGQSHSETRTVGLTVRPPSSTSTFSVVDASWGTPQSIPAAPGDKAVTLNLVIRNTQTYAVSSLYASLDLVEPFTNTTGGSIANSHVDGSVNPGASTTIQFTVNIAQNASVGVYGFNISVTYLDYFSKRQSQNLTADVLLPGRSDIYASLKSGVLVSGTTSYVTVELQNRGSADVYALTAVLSTAGEGTSPSITIDPSTSVQTFTVISPGQTATLKTRAIVSETPTAGIHTLQLALTYRDVYGQSRSLTQNIGVTVAVRSRISPVSISLNDNILTAGIINNRQFTVNNVGNSLISSVWITVSNPSLSGGAASSANSLVSLATGEDRWFFSTIPANSSIVVSPQIFVAPAAVDTTYAMQLTISYTDSDGVPRTDTKTVSLTVQGLIYIQVQDVQISPTRITPGANITIIGNLLNRGNVPAYYATVDAKSKSPYIPSGKQYVGEVDTNTLTPFSILTQVDRRAQNGTYPITLTVSYTDTYNKTRSITSSANIIVVTGQPTGGSTTTTQQTLIAGVTPVGLVFFGVIAILAVVTLAVLWRSRRKMRGKLGDVSHGVT